MRLGTAEGGGMYGRHLMKVGNTQESRIGSGGMRKEGGLLMPRCNLASERQFPCSKTGVIGQCSGKPHHYPCT